MRHYTVKTEQWCSKMLVKSKFKQVRFESSAEERMRVNETKFSWYRLFHTDGPETENARRPNEVRVRTVMAALVGDHLRRLLPGSAAVQ